MRTIRNSRPAPALRYSPLVTAIALALAPQAHATTYTVVNNSATLAGSLYAAVNSANANCATDSSPLIEFAIPTGPFVIAQAANFPPFYCGTGTYTPTVNGYSQTGTAQNSLPDGFDATILITLDGTAFGGCGLNAYGGAYLTVKGLEVRNFLSPGSAGLCGDIVAQGNRLINNETGAKVYRNSVIGSGAKEGRNVIGGNTINGIEVAYGGNATIVNNFIGTLNGTSANPNAVGIRWNGGTPSNAISGNVISGNSTTGLQINQASNLTVTGNKIGTDVLGNSQLANAYGVRINNSYGGPSLTSNTISGNTTKGLFIQDSESITLTSNMIGTNTAGNARLSNGIGLLAQCSSNITLRTNTISGNNSHGVSFGGVDGSTIDTNNRIGTNAGGAKLGNGGSGLIIDAYDCSSQNGRNNLVDNNTIANNNKDGVAITNSRAFGNTLNRNSIYDNGAGGGKNINIDSSCCAPLPNDPIDPLAPGSPPYDADLGPNHRQNYPTITSVVSDGDGSMIVSFRLYSAASTNFRVEVFANPSAGLPGGTYMGKKPSFTTDANGVFIGSATVSGTFDNVSLTATNLTTRDTSEFSPLGIVPGTPSVSFTPTDELDFGNISVGTTSATQTVYVNSIGTAPYRINRFDAIPSCYGSGAFCYGGGFTCTTTCAVATDYPRGNSCSVTASFGPMFLGYQETTIYFCDNTADPPNSILLTGTGVPPPIFSITPSQWDFGSVLVGRRSDVKRFQIHNPNPNSAAIGPLATSGAFVVVSDTCAGTVPGGSSCFGDVAFLPTVPGSQAGLLVVTPAGGGGSVLAPKVTEGPPPTPATAMLVGTGIQSALLQLPSSINLPAYSLGSAPVTKAVQITNGGNAALSISNISTSAPFTVVSNCPPNLAPGESCIATVGFSATTVGPFNGTLVVVSNAPGGSREVPITVVSQLAPNPLIHVVPTFIGFGGRMFGTQSDAQRITISNDGGAVATLTTMTVGIDYLITGNTCGLTLAPTTSCFADVAFRPIGFGPRPGQFTFNSTSPNSPHVVEMLGSGCRPFTISGRGGAASACGP